MSDRKSSHKWLERVQDHELEALTTDDNHNLRAELLSALYAREFDELVFPQACMVHCQWFMEQIAKCFQAMPQQYKQVGVQQQDPTQLNAIGLPEFHRLLIRMCKALLQDGDPELSDLATALQETNILHAEKFDKEEVSQLIFFSLGVLSMLFTPSFEHQPGILKIDLPTKRSRTKTSETWKLAERSLDAINGGFLDILRGFSNSPGPIPRCLDNPRSAPETNTLEARNINFYIIAKLGGLNIVWVDSICMHLELDRREKTLMIFRHPSFCAMLSFGDNKPIFLDRVFREYLKLEDQTTPAANFFREVLVTYRLLFGQDKRSWKLAKALRSQGGLRRVMNRIAGLKSDSLSWDGVSDPLLKTLCTCDGDEVGLYDDLEVPGSRSIYSAQQDFPFFGQRLIAIQEYTRLVQPYDLRTLWFDRRDTNRFYTIWAVIAFSILTLVLALLGIALAAAQVAGSFANNQGQ